jgi:oxygen-independent coproporphyrinogen-3 oxidase
MRGRFMKEGFFPEKLASQASFSPGSFASTSQTLHPFRLSKAPAALFDDPVLIEHLYIHIPFCPNICPYCAFYKESAGRERVETFLDALLKETEVWADQLRPRTIFFGGGTPSALSIPQFEKLLGGLRSRLDLSHLEEWTIEMNPATVAHDKAALLLEAGINRVSMGVQSWDDAVLKSLGRTHDSQKAEESFRILRQAGFDNLSIDLIFGVPGQSLASWRETVERSLRLAPEHLSAYGLTYEEDTEFFLKLGRGEMAPDEGLEADQFELTSALLGEAGYLQYEVSNYALPDRESCHNSAYWAGRDYLGLGPSAFSTVGSRRWRNIRETGIYSESTLAGKTAIDFEERVTEELKSGERAAFGMRTVHGVAEIEARRWEEDLRGMQEKGLVILRNGRWVLTPRGRLLADTVAEIFV